jgi:prophage maintenance system killer protein
VFSSDRILEIHRALVSYFSASADPIRDLGLRDASLLEQAVSHQFSGGESGFGTLEKPAALLQGLFDELPFHDGNAQTAFLALLALLDENGYVPNRVSFDACYEFCAALSEHRLEPAKGPGKSGHQRGNTGHASELALIVRWLEAHMKTEPVRDHPLALVELRRILGGHGFALVEGKSDTLELQRVDADPKKRLFGLGGTRKASDSAPLYRLSVPAGEALVSLTAVRELRGACGVEAELFYDWRARVDSFLRQYQTLLVRLGRL